MANPQLAAASGPEPDFSWVEDEGALRRLSILFTIAKTGWALGVFSRETDRDLLIEALRRNIDPVPVHVISFHESDPNPLVSLHQIAAPAGKPGPVVCFTGIVFAIPELALHLDLQREALARMPHRLVFWVSSAERVWLLEHAPNFCSRLSGTFFFNRVEPRRRQPAPVLALLTRGDEDLLPRSQPRPPFSPAGAVAIAEKLRGEIGALVHPAERAQALLRLAAILEVATPTAGRLAEIHQVYRSAAEAAKAANLPVVEGEAYWRAGAIARLDPDLLSQARMDLEQSAFLFAQVVAQGGHDALRAEIGRAAAEVGLASCDLLDGDFAAAIEKLENAARLYYQRGLYPGQAQVLKSLGAVASLRQEWQKANAALENAARIFERLGKNDQLAATLQLLGDAYLRQGRAEGEAIFQRALGLARESRDLLTEGHTLLSLGHLSMAAGELEEAEAHYLDALTVLRKLGFEPAVANALLSLSGLLLAAGREGEAASARAEANAIHARWGFDRLIQRAKDP